MPGVIFLPRPARASDAGLLLALADDGRELARHRERTPEAYDDVLRAIAGVVARVEADAGGTGTVGVGTPGVLHPSRRVMLNSNLQSLNGRALDRDLAAGLGRPVRLANDGKCFVLSEAVEPFEAGRSYGPGALLTTLYGPNWPEEGVL